MTDTDVLKQTIDVVAEAFPEMWVADHLPPTTEMDAKLPCIVIDVLPGQTRETAWNGDDFPVILDEVVLDAEVFAQSRGQAVPVAQKLRQVLYQLPHIATTDVAKVDCPELVTREDLNPRVKVLGAEAELVKR